MLYNKPKNVTYTQMAIIIDNTAYSDSCDDELIYQYLYLLSYMLAVKACYFNSAHLYNDFSILMANTAFMRLKNPKQFILDENGEPKLKKIKSILNYLKTILYPKKVDFEQENYAQTEIYVEELNDKSFSGFTFADKLSEAAEKLIKVEFNCCLESLSNYFKFYLKKIPYKYKSSKWYNIYVSCLLTFLDSIVIDRRNFDFLEKWSNKNNDISGIERCYKKQNENIILYHLEDNMKDYIKLLVREIRTSMAKDFSELIYSDICSYDMNSLLIRNEINSRYKNQEV